MNGISFSTNPSETEFDEAVDLVFSLEKWPLCKSDLRIHRQAFGDDFVFAIAKAEEGRVVGCASCTWQKSVEGSPPLGYFSCFLVHPDYRGRGIGHSLYGLVMRPGENCSLNAGGDMSKKYAERKGFDKFFPFALVLHSIQPSHISREKLEEIAQGNAFKTPSQIDLDQLGDYDKSIVNVDRREQMKLWATREESTCRISLDKDGQVDGFCIIRRVPEQDVTVSPCFADSLDVARRLMAATLLAVPQLETFDTLFFNLVSTNMELLPFFEEISNGRVENKQRGPCYKQCTNHLVPLKTNKVFCTTSMSLSFT